MNNRLIKLFSLIASCSLFAIGCGSGNDAFKSAGSTTENAGVVSSDNFTILSSELNPAIFSGNTLTFTELTITARVGDRQNQLLSDSHKVFFATEWGLIEPSCTTVNGSCTVKWQTSSFGTAPADKIATIIAYTEGEESFQDLNGDGIYNDGDGNSFTDIEEPYVDANENSVHDSGEPIIDVRNGLDDTGGNGVHDFGDGFFNGNNCEHSSLCSQNFKTIFVWNKVSIDMNAPATP